jgi:hypothetical protein
MINKDGSITILASEVAQGVADSPYVGFGKVVNLDVFSTPGIVKIARRMESVYQTTEPVIAFARDTSSGVIYSATGGVNALISRSTDGVTWTPLFNLSTACRDIEIYQDYLWLARNASLDCYGPLSGSPRFFSDVAALTSAEFHQMKAAADGFLHIGNGSNVAKISNFVSGNPPTFSFSSSALDLPSLYKIKPITELGRFLCVGTYTGANIYDNPVGAVFPWDKASDSFNDPVFVNDKGVSQLISENGLLYASVGVQGRLLVSDNLSYFRELRTIPLSPDIGENLNNYPNAMEVQEREILFGLAQNGGNLGPIGVYSYRNGAVILKNTISEGSDGTTGSDLVKIYAVLPVSGDRYLVSWSVGDTYGTDITSFDTKYDNYQAYFETPLYPVGTNLSKKTYQFLEYRLGKPLVAGQSLRFKYRLSLDDAFTDIGTFSTSNTANGSVTHRAIAGIPECEQVQLRVELSQETTTASNSNVELTEVRII